MLHIRTDLLRHPPHPRCRATGFSSRAFGVGLWRFHHVPVEPCRRQEAPGQDDWPQCSSQRSSLLPRHQAHRLCFIRQVHQNLGRTHWKVSLSPSLCRVKSMLCSRVPHGGAVDALFWLVAHSPQGTWRPCGATWRLCIRWRGQLTAGCWSAAAATALWKFGTSRPGSSTWTYRVTPMRWEGRVDAVTPSSPYGWKADDF